eukprot:g6669.t1
MFTLKKFPRFCFRSASTSVNEGDGQRQILHQYRNQSIPSQNTLTWSSPYVFHERARRVENSHVLTPTMKRFVTLENAIRNTNVSLMERLLNEPAANQSPWSHEWTPLILASSLGFLDGVKLLIRRGADLKARSSTGLTCLLAAAKNQHHAVLLYLLSLPTCPLNDTEEATGYTALHYVTLFNNATEASRLIHSGAKVNAMNVHGETPLFLAAKYNRSKSLSALLVFGADPNICTKDGRYALSQAMSQCHVECVWLLLSYGANSLRIEKDGFSALGFAIENKNIGMMKLLLDRGVDTEQICDFPSRPLLKACSIGYLDGVKLLVERGADITVQTTDGLTCLIIALKNRHFSVLSYLLEQEFCPINVIDEQGYSALHYTILLTDGSWTNALLRKGADMNAKTQDGESPVFLATKNKSMCALQALLQSGADPNIICKNGDYALHEAVRQGSGRAVRMLLRHGADKTKIGKDGLAPVDLAYSSTLLNQDVVNSLTDNHQVNHNVNNHEHLTDELAQNKAQRLQTQVDQCIYCPITFEVMLDPVIAADGHTYERTAIGKWLSQKKISPITRQPISSDVLIPNLAIKHLVDLNAITFEDS